LATRSVAPVLLPKKIPIFAIPRFSLNPEMH
jgi:hypothetical protein